MAYHEVASISSGMGQLIR